MFDVSAAHDYVVEYKKGTSRFLFTIGMRPIPDGDMLALDQLAQRVYQAQEDNSIVIDSERREEQRRATELFDKYAETVNGKPAQEQLPDIPWQVKRATVIGSCGAVQVAPEPVREVFDLKELQSEETEVKLEHVTFEDGKAVVHSLKHYLREPSEEDNMEYLRATGKLRLLPGRRRLQYSTVERFGIYGQLYDRLASRTEGYAANGAELNGSKESLKHVPYLHKKVAVQALFGRAYPGDLGED